MEETNDIQVMDEETFTSSLNDSKSMARTEASPLSAGVTNVDAYALLESQQPKGPSALSIGAYDNIGDALTKDTIDAYIKSKKGNITRTVNMTVLHNSATPAQYDKGLDTVKAFYNYHVNNNGWKSIGYHFVISTEGVIYAGRKMEEIGAHAGPTGNPNSIGVCLVGNFETTDKPTEAQKKAFSALQISLNKNLYGGNSLKPRFHREFMDTGCPGKITQDEVMTWINTYIGSGSNNPKVMVDGVEIGYGITVDGSTYAKVRDFEKAGYTVGWVQATNTATLTSPKKSG
jgi:hypothetical protein